MSTAEHKDFAKADEVRTFPNGEVELLHIGGSDIGRLILQPGWRWSEHVKPLAGTDLCEAPHFQYHVAGTLRIEMADGTQFDAVPGQVTALPSGHDAWVVGDEPVIVVDWWGASNYAKGRPHPAGHGLVRARTLGEPVPLATRSVSALRPLCRLAARELQGHAGQRGTIAEQLILDLGIAGGGVCGAGFLVIEVAARPRCVRIRADGQPRLGHGGE
jgi:hypothetical protein